MRDQLSDGDRRVERILGLEVRMIVGDVAFEEVQERYPPDDHDLFVAVGLRDVNRQRAAKVLEAEAA